MPEFQNELLFQVHAQQTRSKIKFWYLPQEAVERINKLLNAVLDYIPKEITDDIPLSLWQKIKQLLNRKEKNEEKFIHHWIDWKLTIQLIVNILGFIIPTIWALTRMWFGTHAFAGNLWIDLYNYERNVHFHMSWNCGCYRLVC